MGNGGNLRRVKCKHRELVESLLKIKLASIVFNEIIKVFAGFHGDIIIEQCEEEVLMRPFFHH